MTELEKIAYAKGFIDKLANGINPIDDSVIPDGDVVNNVRLSRCFFFVSDILRQVVDNGGITPAPIAKEKKTKKHAYYLSAEQAASFEYSKEAIPISELARRIFAVGPQEGVKKFSLRTLTKWLLFNDFLEVKRESDGAKYYVPTELGESVGIELEERVGMYGTYRALLYSEEAQHFIIDNLEAVSSFDKSAYKAKMNLANQGKPWDAEQDERLIFLYKEGKTISELAIALQRGERAVKIRLRKNGINVDSIEDARPVNVGENEAPSANEAATIEAEKKEAAPIEAKVKEAIAEMPEREEKNAQKLEAQEPEISCQSCRFARSGECFPQATICKDYQKAYEVPKSERDAWPEMGDASYLKQTGKHRQ